MPIWWRRAGQKRSYSKVKKPGRDHKKKSKLSYQVKPVVAPVSASCSDEPLTDPGFVCAGSLKESRVRLLEVS